MAEERLIGVGGQKEPAIRLLFERVDDLAIVEFRRERRDLLLQIVDQPLPGDDREAGNVVDRLFRIELGALPAGPVENVDDVAFEIEQPQLEHGKQANGARANDDDVGFDRICGHSGALKVCVDGDGQTTVSGARRRKGRVPTGTSVVPTG